MSLNIDLVILFSINTSFNQFIPQCIALIAFEQFFLSQQNKHLNGSNHSEIIFTINECKANSTICS